MTDIEAARAIYLTPIPVESLSKEELSLQAEDPNMPAIMRGFDLDIDRIQVRSGFEEMTLEGNESEYLGVNIDHAFSMASLNKPIRDNER